MTEINIMDYIKPELVIVAIVLYIIGVGIKKTQTIKDNLIPYILGLSGIFLSGIWVFANCPISNGQEIATAVFMAITQGILMAGLSTYVNQLIKQLSKDQEPK